MAFFFFFLHFECFTDFDTARLEVAKSESLYSYVTNVKNSIMKVTRDLFALQYMHIIV